MDLWSLAGKSHGVLQQPKRAEVQKGETGADGCGEGWWCARLLESAGLSQVWSSVGGKAKCNLDCLDGRVIERVFST